ncbi:MAG: cohesin domain-containing protein [Pirellulales bacterium]
MRSRNLFTPYCQFEDTLLGHRVVVPVQVDRSGADIYSLDLVLRYDAAALAIESAAVGIAAGGMGSAFNLQEAGTIRIGLAGSQPLSEDGAVVELAFNVIGPLNTPAPVLIESARLNEGKVAATLGDGAVQDTIGPVVLGWACSDGALQRSHITGLAIQFGENVSAALGAGDLTLRNDTTGIMVDLAGVTPGFDPATNTATWSLAGVALDDGYYTALLSAAGVADAAGNPLLSGDYTIEFFRLLGDADGSASVDIFDVAKLQVNYGQTSGMTPADGDFDLDGDVDIFDVALLQVQYRKTVAPPAPAAEAVDQATSELLLSAMPSAADDLAEAVALARVSTPTARTALPTRPATANGTSASWASVDRRHVRRHGVHAASRPMQPVAVRHAVEDASWESAVDRWLESEEGSSHPALGQ